MSMGSKGVVLSLFQALLSGVPNPGLAPWAAFFRRFAAGALVIGEMGGGAGSSAPAALRNDIA